MGVETDLKKGNTPTGFFEMYGSLESLKLLFEPLVINSSTSREAMDHQHEASSFWVYSIDQIKACINLGEEAVLQVFDNPVYNVTNNITLTAETFTILLDNLYIEQVFQHEVGYRDYMAYSQAVPEGASIDELVFVIFFMSPMQPLEWFGEYIHSNTEDMQRKVLYSVLFVIVSAFIVVYLVVILITRKIIRAIIKLRYFSITMK